MKINKNIIIRKILPVVAGAIIGFLYYKYYGCNGTCPISGNPYISTGYGAVLGLLLTFNTKPNKKVDKAEK